MKLNRFFFSIFLLTALLSACSDKSTDNSENPKSANESSVKSDRPENSTPLVELSKVASMSKEELRIARNTIYAKYGRIFTSEDLTTYFKKQPWYKENPRFKESDLKPEDKRLAKIISLWENKSEVLWREKLDMSGNGNFEFCYVLYNNKSKTFALIINDYFKEFKHHWGQSGEENPPKEWAKIHVEAIDIVPDDGRQEIHIHQRYSDWEDPGTENFIITFDQEMHSTELSSTNYDGGTLEFKDGIVNMRVSYCPEHTRKYRLERGKLVKFDEDIEPVPPGGCAACFSGDTHVATSITSSKPISSLKKGDEILSYNTRTGALEQTKVQRVLEVYHEELYEISFGGQTLTLTDDHPLWISGKGWASLSPEKTRARYANYASVVQLSTGDLLQFANGKVARIDAVTQTNGRTTYTVESLENGQSMIVNGIVAGTETRK